MRALVSSPAASINFFRVAAAAARAAESGSSSPDNSSSRARYASRRAGSSTGSTPYFRAALRKSEKPFLNRWQLSPATFDIRSGNLQFVQRFRRFDLRPFKSRHRAIETTVRLLNNFLKMALRTPQTARCHTLAIKLGDRAVDRLYQLLRVHQHLAPLGKNGFFSRLGR